MLGDIGAGGAAVPGAAGVSTGGAALEACVAAPGSSGRRGAGVAGTEGALEVLGEISAKRGVDPAAGSDGALEVLGGASGSRADCAAGVGTDGALEVLGGASGRRAVCAAGVRIGGALEVFDGASGTRAVCAARVGIEGALEVFGGASGRWAVCAAWAGTDGALEVRGGGSPARDACPATGSDEAPEIRDGTSESRGGDPALSETGGMLELLAPVGGNRGAAVSGRGPGAGVADLAPTVGHDSGSSPAGGFEAGPTTEGGRVTVAETGCDGGAAAPGRTEAPTDGAGLGSSGEPGARVPGGGAIPEGCVGPEKFAVRAGWGSTGRRPGACAPGLSPPAAGGAPVPLPVRGGGRPEPGDGSAVGSVAARGGVAAVRGHVGIALVGIRSGGRPGVGAAAPAAVPVEGRPGEVDGRKPGLAADPGGGWGTGVRTGGRSNTGPGRGIGVSIGI